MNKSASLPTEAFGGSRYEIVAWCRGHEILYYREFGSYQGEWVMLSHCDGEYYIWKDYYGSCSGCDDYEASMDWGDLHAQDKAVVEFAEKYVPFLEVPAATMKNLAAQGPEAVGRIMPANIRNDYDEIGWDGLFKDIVLCAKLREQMEIALPDVMEANDQELKQRALKEYGYERFVADSDAKTLHQDGDNWLLGIGDMRLLSLKDSSTDRRYLLRVPDHIQRTREGVAWTFGLEENEYRPLVET